MDSFSYLPFHRLGVCTRNQRCAWSWSFSYSITCSSEEKDRHSQSPIRNFWRISRMTASVASMPGEAMRPMLCMVLEREARKNLPSSATNLEVKALPLDGFQSQNNTGKLTRMDSTSKGLTQPTVMRIAEA